MGKGSGALNMWIREFTSLVFTQTIQAFIYAMVITIILYGMVNTSGVSSDDNSAALGLMSTFALLSVFKVEEMAKRIFGVQDTKASPGNAMRSIAKTAIAAQLGKRVLNNAGKVTQGIGSVASSRKENAKAKKRLNEDMSDNGFKMGANGKPEFVGKTRSSSGGGYSDASARGATGGVDFSGGSSRASGGNDVSASDKARVRNALRSYEDRVSEIKKQRQEGIKNIVSGIVETAGAGVGGTAGMILGGADGNLDEALQGLVGGAGVGDAIGESTVNSINRATKFVQRQAKRQKGISTKELQKSIDAYKEAYKKSYGIDDIE